MQESEGGVGIETRERVSARQCKAQRRRRRGTGELGELEISLNGVAPPVDARDLIVKKPGSLASIAQPKMLTRAAEAADQRAPQEALEIERHIWPELSRLPEPGDKTRRSKAAELAAGEDSHVVDIWVAAKKGSP